MYSVAGGSPVPASVAESVSGVAPAAERLCARGSVVLSSHVTAPPDARRGPSHRGHCHLAQVRHVPTGTLAVLARRLGTVSASPSTWYRLVRQYGWRRPRLRLHPAKPKVGLRTTAADEMWHIDTTVIRLLDGTRAYVHAVIDNFSRRILAWRVAETFAPGNSVAVLLEASRNATRSASTPVVLADAGVENVNAQVDALIETGVLRRLLALTELKFSNSMIEAWWRSLKHQWLFLHSLDSIATIRRLVTFYVHQHNHVLPHSAFRGQTPDEMYFYEAACQLTPMYRKEVSFCSTHLHESRARSSERVNCRQRTARRQASCLAERGGSHFYTRSIRGTSGCRRTR